MQCPHCSAIALLPRQPRERERERERGREPLYVKRDNLLQRQEQTTALPGNSKEKNQIPSFSAVFGSSCCFQRPPPSPTPSHRPPIRRTRTIGRSDLGVAGVPAPHGACHSALGAGGRPAAREESDPPPWRAAGFRLVSQTQGPLVPSRYLDPFFPPRSHAYKVLGPSKKQKDTKKRQPASKEGKNSQLSF